MLTVENICRLNCITSERIGDVEQKMANECAHGYNRLPGFGTAVQAEAGRRAE